MNTPQIVQKLKEIWDIMKFTEVDHIFFEKAITLVKLQMEGNRLSIASPQRQFQYPVIGCGDLEKEYGLSDDEEDMPEEFISLKYHTIVKVALDTYYKYENFAEEVIQQYDPLLWTQLLVNDVESDRDCVICHKYISNLQVTYYMYHVTQMHAICEHCHVTRFNLDNILK
jgi:hypothetical protein